MDIDLVVLVLGKYEPHEASKKAHLCTWASTNNYPLGEDPISSNEAKVGQGGNEYTGPIIPLEAKLNVILLRVW